MTSLLSPLFDALGRLFVSLSVPFPEAAERLKSGYVSAATRSQAKVTDSQVSIATGLQRRDIARIRKDTGPIAPPPNPLARIVAVWQTDPAFKGRVLPRSGDASFDTLARSVRQDVHPRTFLDGLVASGTVQVDDDQVTLIADAYRPTAGSADQLAYLSANVGDHLLAAQSNLQQADLFERAVHYDHLTRAQVDRLHDIYRHAQMDVLKMINDHAVAMQNSNPDGANHRFRAGGYFWWDTTEKADE